jgi:SHR-binding domain of vacuolar-sorting associated protein 13
VYVQVKQRGTPDPGVPFGPEGIKRSACQLPDGASTAFFWDDNTAPKCVVARLASDGPGAWEWSGGFALPEKEDYLGLRMHHTDASGVRDGQTVIVPVSIAVDACKVVLISFKARQNLPPYKIRNSCAAVDIIVFQHVDSVRIHSLVSHDFSCALTCYTIDCSGSIVGTR